MEQYVLPVQLRWSDMDPNAHIRHSVYYDWGAMIRMNFLNEAGLTMAFMQQHQFGPILFREECVFRKEIHFGDTLSINMMKSKARRDFSRFSFRHEIRKQGDLLAAVLEVDGAWLNVKERKLFTPPPLVKEGMDKVPSTEDFGWLD